MQTRNHLSDDELAEMLTERGKTSPHFADCPACKAGFENLRHALQSLPSHAVAATSMPDDFWQKQQLGIRTLIASEPAQTHRFPALAWVSALAVAVLAGVLLNGITRPVPTAEALTDPDHELLVEVERIMRSDSVSALQPASLLVQEINRNAEYDSTPRKKETHREN